MLEIVDRTGRILGLLNEQEAGIHPVELRHRKTIRVALILPMPARWSPRTYMEPKEVTIEAVDFAMHEIPLRAPGEVYGEPVRLRSRWYLVPLGELPENTWKARGFIDLRNSWGQ